MKIRIRDNSIRLRLSRGEVDAVRADNVVSSRTAFPGEQAFTYTLESSPACVNPVASFANNEIKVRLPESEVERWSTTEQVSIRGDQLLEDGANLAILVEKDFACLAPRDGEDESDLYVHPNAHTGAC